MAANGRSPPSSWLTAERHVWSAGNWWSFDPAICLPEARIVSTPDQTRLGVRSREILNLQTGPLRRHTHFRAIGLTRHGEVPPPE